MFTRLLLIKISFFGFVISDKGAFASSIESFESRTSFFP